MQGVLRYGRNILVLLGSHAAPRDGSIVDNTFFLVWPIPCGAKGASHLQQQHQRASTRVTCSISTSVPAPAYAQQYHRTSRISVVSLRVLYCYVGHGVYARVTACTAVRVLKVLSGYLVKQYLVLVYSILAQDNDPLSAASSKQYISPLIRD